jgi:hypothetical protein
MCTAGRVLLTLSLTAVASASSERVQVVQVVQVWAVSAAMVAVVGLTTVPDDGSIAHPSRGFQQRPRPAEATRTLGTAAHGVDLQLQRAVLPRVSLALDGLIGHHLTCVFA